MILTLIETEKDTAYKIGYQIGYWLTAFLPVILGFGITMLLIWYFTKTYKGEEDETDDEFKND